MQLKAMGLVAGVSDMTYLSKSGPIFLEFKTETGKQTTKQKEWQSTVEAAGYRYVIIRSFADFAKSLDN